MQHFTEIHHRIYDYWITGLPRLMATEGRRGGGGEGRGGEGKERREGEGRREKRGGGREK